MKYLYMMRAIWYFIFQIFRKIVGIPIFYMVLPFRGYARNVVHNYILQTGMDFPSLTRRPITEGNKFYRIDKFHGSEGGYIRKRKISWIEFQLVYWFIWGWLDDASNYDTMDKGHLRRIIEGERLTWMPKFILRRLKRSYDTLPEYGNSFDIGDRRAENASKPYGKDFWGSFLWIVRNTAYNFKYMQYEDSEQLFLYEWKYFWFGYVQEGHRGYYKLHIGFPKEKYWL